jgi:hypothetical protein
LHFDYIYYCEILALDNPVTKPPEEQFIVFPAMVRVLAVQLLLCLDLYWLLVEIVEMVLLDTEVPPNPLMVIPMADVPPVQLARYSL